MLRTGFSAPSRSISVCSGSDRWLLAAAVMIAFLIFIGLTEGQCSPARFCLHRLTRFQAAEYNFVMPGRASSELELLKAALIGFQAQIAEIEKKMMVIRQQLAAAGGGRTPAAPTSDSASTGATPVRKKRRLSAAGRKRIIEATKKRWAE